MRQFQERGIAAPFVLVGIALLTASTYGQVFVPANVSAPAAGKPQLQLKPAMKVRGKVVDAQTGTGVPGVRVNLYYQNQRGRGGMPEPVTTDKNGEFVLFGRPGKATVQIWQIPDQYLNPAGVRQQQTVDVKADMTLEPVRLQRARTIEGIVVDTSGKPVAGARIYCRSLNMSDTYFANRDVHSDREGKFSLKNVGPTASYSIRARTGKAAADPSGSHSAAMIAGMTFDSSVEP